MKPENYPVEPAHLWRHFYQFSRIPRPSGKEQVVRQYVIDQAEALDCPWRMDDEGNLLLSVPGSAGREREEAVIIQNHLDMVTVKTQDKQHDFHTDPLQLQVQDGWLLADRTTLGADNGIGCAAALALMTDPAVQHPPLQLLFTVDEETGLGGALSLDASLLQGRRMLNLDTEDWHELYIGCAGGGGWELRRTLRTEAVPAGFSGYTLQLSGLAGGHSGIQIHQQLGNAIKLLGQCLDRAPGQPLRLAGFDAGVAHNVIPREGEVSFASELSRAELQALADACREDWLGYLPAADAQLQLVVKEQAVERVLAADEQRDLLDLITVFPHGPQAYNLAQPADLVDLSINLAVLQLRDGQLFVESSFRFFNEVESQPLIRQVEVLARRFDLQLTPVAGYPGWQPVFDSPLLALASETHEQLFGNRPAVKAIHAGLECGILKSKKPDMDILSFGPTIRGAHSPTERLQIDTVGPFWQLLTELLKRL